MNKVALFCIGLLFASCSSTTDIAKLLDPHADYKITYDCEFFDPSIRSDTLREKVILVVKSIEDSETNERRADYYYDLLDQDPYREDEIQSSNYFIDALFFRIGDTLFGQSIIWNMNSNEIDLSDANIKLAGKFAPGDSLYYTDGSFDYLITGFEKETVELPFGRVRNCIRLDQSTVYLEDWTEGDESSFETVWIHKKYGVVKWIRRTGRIEEMSGVIRK